MSDHTHHSSSSNSDSPARSSGTRAEFDRDGIGGIGNHRNVGNDDIGGYSSFANTVESRSRNLAQSAVAVAGPRVSPTSTPSSAFNKHKSKNKFKDNSSNTESAGSAGTGDKRKRTKSGCWTCRRRKIKCDEAHPACQRCLRSKLVCEGYPDPSTLITSFPYRSPSSRKTGVGGGGGARKGSGSGTPSSSGNSVNGSVVAAGTTLANLHSQGNSNGNARSSVQELIQHAIERGVLAGYTSTVEPNVITPSKTSPISSAAAIALAQVSGCQKSHTKLALDTTSHNPSAYATCVDYTMANTNVNNSDDESREVSPARSADGGRARKARRKSAPPKRGSASSTSLPSLAVALSSPASGSPPILSSGTFGRAPQQNHQQFSRDQNIVNTGNNSNNNIDMLRPRSPASMSDETISTSAANLSRVPSQSSVFQATSRGTAIADMASSVLNTPSVGQSSASSSAFEQDFVDHLQQRNPEQHQQQRGGQFHRQTYPGALRGLASSQSGINNARSPVHSSLPSFSQTLAPAVHNASLSNLGLSPNTFAPFAFDSPFPMQPFAIGASPAAAAVPTSAHAAANSTSLVQASTPIDFDSLFGYTSKNLQSGNTPGSTGTPSSSGNVGGTQGGGAGAVGNVAAPVDYWNDSDYLDRIMAGFKNAGRQQQQQQSPADDDKDQVMQPITEGQADTSDFSPSHLQINSPMSLSMLCNLNMAQGSSGAPSLSSGRSSAISPTAPTPPSLQSPYGQGPDPTIADSRSHSPHSMSSSLTALNRSSHRRQPSSASAASTAATTRNSAVNTTMADFAPQPAIDPILQASSTGALHKTAANRNKGHPSLLELEMGPPPTLHHNQKEWSIPPVMVEAMKSMTDARHVELLKHYFINLVGLFNPIDHPKNPFRVFVAEHATESLALLHAVLAVSAINQQPLSVEARAESLLYFEAAVDLYVRSLQQQDDISLFTLLFLSLYYAFDSGTAQPQHFSRRAQSIINDRLELLGANLMQGSSDLKFLVRVHTWYEVMANVSRRAGDLRDMDCGRYTLAYLLSVIEKWDAQEEKACGLSGVNADYVMTGCVGVPTFFLTLLNDIATLKEEQHAILVIPIEALDEGGLATRKALISKHTRKIRDLECKIQFARPGRLLLPPIVANEAQLHRAVSVRFFDLFRLAASIHLLVELQGMPVSDPAVQVRASEMVNLLGNIEQNSNYNTSGIWAFFIAGAAASNHMDRIALHRRLDSTWNTPCGNIWSLRSVLDEVWQRNAEAMENHETLHNWKDVAHQRGWTLLLM